MIYKLVFGCCLLWFSMISCAQSKYGIKRIDAFFRQHQPGNIPVNEKGQPIQHGPDTVNTIYVETKDATIKWTAAWQNGKSFNVTTVQVDETPLVVGTRMTSNEEIILDPEPGNKLWRLDLLENGNLSKPPVKGKRGEIILQGKLGKRSFVQKIRSQIELTSIPSV